MRRISEDYVYEKPLDIVMVSGSAPGYKIHGVVGGGGKIHQGKFG